MERYLLKSFLIITVLLCATTAALADLKIKMKNGQSNNASTMYMKNERQRIDTENGGIIVQCDLKRTVILDDRAKTYMVSSFDRNNSPANSTGATATQPQQDATRRGGIVTHTTTVTDTKERKQMFGFTARHLKTSTVVDSSPDACNKQKYRMETDGWYIDLDMPFSCEMGKNGGYSSQAAGGGCQDEYRNKQIGTAKIGYPVLVTTTMYNEDGTVSSTTTMEVVELSTAPLNASLFEVPADYTEMKIGQASPSYNDEAARNHATAGKVAQGSEQNNANASTTPNAAQALGPKKPGVIRIGVVTPKAQMGQGSNGIDPAEPIRNTIINYLSGPAIEVTPITSRIAMQIEAEAKQKECDFILYSTVTQKQGGGGLGGFLKKASPAASVANMAGMGGSTTGAVAGAVAATTIYTVADIAGSIKAKDELTFEYKLFPTGSATPRVANSTKAKAKSDGDDVLSPMIEQAATAVLTDVMKK